MSDVKIIRATNGQEEAIIISRINIMMDTPLRFFDIKPALDNTSTVVPKETSCSK